LLQLGFTIAEPTVSRYLQQLKRHPDEGKAPQWLAFLNNHREVIYCFLVIAHGRRRVLHFNVTTAPDERLDCASTKNLSSYSRNNFDAAVNLSLPGRIAIIGNYLPRQCGTATFHRLM
jgi:hypothetical protein